MFILLTIFISMLYVSLILLFIVGWNQTNTYNIPKTFHTKKNVSIIVPCKNESSSIRFLLEAFLVQTHTQFELILIDDHSSDNTYAIFEHYKDKFSDIRILKSKGNGKKNALVEGIACSKGDIIISTDADCIPNARWVECILSFYVSTKADLIICPVQLIDKGTFASQLEAIEFASLVASGAGAAGLKIPILCNGANLAFTKKAWLASSKELHEEEISGDDIFLLQSIKRRKGTILFLKSQWAMVQTEGASSIKRFISQRKRWAGKTPAYTDPMTIWTALTVFAMSFLQIVACLFCVVGKLHFSVILALFVGKYIIDISLLLQVKSFFGLRHVLLYSLVLSFIYPIYSSYVAFSALICKPKQWNN